MANQFPSFFPYWSPGGMHHLDPWTFNDVIEVGGVVLLLVGFCATLMGLGAWMF